MSTLNTITESLLAMDQDKVLSNVNSALAEGISGQDILKKGLIAAMDVVGEKMQTGSIFLPEVLRAAQIMKQAVEVIRPSLGEAGIQATGKVVMGTVKGDLHDIGKNLVVLLLESAGFVVHDLGTDVSPDAFVSAIKENGAGLVGLSALLTTTMPMMQQTVEAIMENGLRDQVKILIGGAPVTQNFADKIGVDGYAPDAGSATRIAKSLCA